MRKGIILAGGNATRLMPVTNVVSKQLLPVYDKPMIYYPLSCLMLAGIRDVLIISRRRDLDNFNELLKDGRQLGMNIEYLVQDNPDGIAQAPILAREFLSGSPSLLILGDNLFYGASLSGLLQKANAKTDRATVFGYHVNDPERYGVIEFTHDNRVKRLVEKPAEPPSNYVLTGIYFLPADAPELAKQIVPSERGELEIVDLLEKYIRREALDVELMGRGFAWLDTGTNASLLEASNYVQTVVKRQGLQIGCLEEIAFSQGWIGLNEVKLSIKNGGKSEYFEYLNKLISKAGD